MVDWVSGMADASVAERNSGFTLVRVPGSPDVLKETPVSDFVTKASNGFVGIGGENATPIANLQVNVSFAITGSGGVQSLLIGNQDSIGAEGPAIIRSANKAIEFGYGNSWAFNTSGGTFTQTMNIQANGDVGIGAPGPVAKLHINKPSAAPCFFLAGNPSGGAALGVRTDGSMDIGAFASRGMRFGNYNAGGTFLENAQFDASGNFLPGSDNGFAFGTGAKRWSVLYSATGTINTSDERSKTDIGEIPDAWLDAWAGVEWRRFKFIDGNRWHIGLVAQQVHAAFAAHDLDAFEIGLCCFDKWDEQRGPIYDTRTVIEKYEAPTDEVYKSGPRKGEPKMETLERDIEEIYDTGETRVTLEAGDRWGLRYDECQAIEAAWQRREFARMAARLAALEAVGG